MGSDSFLRSSSNKRSDRYGGGVENRSRFLFEVVDRVVARIGAERVGFRISPEPSSDGTLDDDPETLLDFIARGLQERKVAYVHLIETPQSRSDVKFFSALRERYSGPIIINGGFDGASASLAVEEGVADFVAFGRPFISNPDLVERLKQGAPLTPPDENTFYGGDERGYTDYPALAAG